MENLKKFFEWSKKLPFWIRAVLYALVAAVALIASLSMSACGTPKTVATVQNVNPNSSVTVTMTVSNSTSSTVETDATPSVTLPN